MNRRSCSAGLAAWALSGCSSPPATQRPPSAVQRLHAHWRDWQTHASEGARCFYLGAAWPEDGPFEQDVQRFGLALQARHPRMPGPLVLSNRSGAGALTASPTHLEQSLRVLAGCLHPQDRLILALSGHGLPGQMTGNQLGASAVPVLAYADLARWLDALAPRPCLVMISACYAASALQWLKAPHLLVAAAAAANRPSFGCAPSNQHTWFMQAWLDSLQRLAPEQPLQSIWEATLLEVTRLEKAQGRPASLPQWQVGRDVADWPSLAL